MGAELENQSVDFYMSQQRRLLQSHGDPNPPTLYPEQVLRNAKHENISRQYKHPDPITSLKIMERSSIGIDVIREIGSDPFFVSICSTHQIRLHNRYIETY